MEDLIVPGLVTKDTRKSFRKIALSEHPDVNPEDPESEERSWVHSDTYWDIEWMEDNGI